MHKKIPKPGNNNLQAIALFLLSVGFYMAVARILFLLSVLVWQQQDFLSYCWFLCGSNKTSYCWFLCDNNKVSLFLYAWSVRLEFEVDEVLELSGK